MATDQKLSQLIQRAPDGTEFVEVIIPPFTPGTNRKVLLSDLVALADPYTTPFPRVDITGTTAYTGTLSPVITAYTNGMKVHVKAKDTSTGGVTLNLNSVGAKQVWINPTTQASTGDLSDEQDYILSYDSALNGGAGVFLILTRTNTAPTAAVGTNTTQVATTEFVNQNRSQGLAFSDEATPITAAPDKLTLHWPYTTTFLEIWIELKTAQASGSIFTVDVHKNGTTILSTKLTIDNTEETSLTAATPPVISVSSVTKGDRITVDVDQVGNGTAVGGKIWFRG